jgi:hypothetical protein
MQELVRFEEAFATFIELTYNDIYIENKWKYDQAQRQANYQILFDSLLALLTVQAIGQHPPARVIRWHCPSPRPFYPYTHVQTTNIRFYIFACKAKRQRKISQLPFCTHVTSECKETSMNALASRPC